MADHVVTERAVRIGTLLPEHVDNFDLDDPAVRAELRLSLREFEKSCAAIAAFEVRARDES